MPRDWPPELAARLAMVDSEARAAVADARANAEGGGAEPPDSDDDSLQTPGRAPSRFIVHDEYAGTPSTGRRVNIFNFFSDSDDDAMDLDSNPESMAGASEASEASTTHDTRPSNPIPNHRFGGAPSPPSPPLFSLNQDSDRENRAPLPSFESGDEADADGDGEDPFYAPHTSYQSNMYLHDPGSPVKPFLPYATAATDPTLSHLREISGLASWTVSSYKPSCGVPALLNPSTATFWQSDGPQPHLLNIHFFKLVRIVKLRVYLDFELDESYTPTRLAFAAGTHEYDAVEFAEWKWDGLGPKGWVDVDLSQCGSDEERERELIDDLDGEDAGIAGVLRCFFLQVRVLENHQNGKDTHIRGIQIFARDERVKKVMRRLHEHEGDDRVEEVRQGMEEADWMGEPELR